MKLVSEPATALLTASILALPGAAVAVSINDYLAGKLLVAPGQEITAHADGKLTGKVGKNLDIDLLGTWEIKNGKWCRTLTRPKGAAGTACQDLKMGDGEVTITGSRGPVTFVLK